MKRAIAFLWLCGFVAACDDGPQSHVYVAHLYEPSRGCLDPTTTLAIIDTSNGSLECDPTCLVENAPPAEGEARVYVSTMCGPYPSQITDTTGTDPACVGALAAFDAGSVCGDDDDGGEVGTQDGAIDADAQ